MDLARSPSDMPVKQRRIWSWVIMPHNFNRANETLKRSQKYQITPNSKAWADPPLPQEEGYGGTDAKVQAATHSGGWDEFLR